MKTSPTIGSCRNRSRATSCGRITSILFDSNYAVPPEKLEHLEARVGTSMYAFGPFSPGTFLDTPRLLYERLTDWVDTTGRGVHGAVSRLRPLSRS